MTTPPNPITSTEQIEQSESIELESDYSGYSLAKHLVGIANEAQTSPIKDVLRSVRSLWRKFMLGNGFIKKRNASNLTDASLIKYRATNLACVKRFYSRHREAILEKKRERRLKAKQTERETDGRPE